MKFNILTSSDSTLVTQIAVSLTVMAKYLPNDSIDFYLLHSSIDSQSIQMLSDLCTGLGNIVFHEVQVPNPESYDPFVQAGRWVRETYYSLCAHQLLPDTIDRILYLDAGDTLVVGDISPYYMADFEDNFLIVTGQLYKHDENGKLMPFEKKDLHNKKVLSGVLNGLFNSGSYVMNLKKMREAGIDLNFYYKLNEWIKENSSQMEDGSFYFGDQGLLSAAFIDHLKYYGVSLEKNGKWYTPYNFCIGYYQHFDKKPEYQPAILHFAGVPFKPWKANYPIFPKRYNRVGGTPRELSELKPLQIEYYFQWLEYLFLTDKVLQMLGY